MRIKPTFNKATLRVFAVAITAVMCTLVILSAVFPFPEGQWNFLSIGTSQKTLANPDWLSSDYTYRKELAVSGSSDGNQTNYQIRQLIQYGLGAKYTSTASTVNIATQIYAIAGNYLYWAENYAGDTTTYYGYIYKTNLIDSVTTKLTTLYGFAAFECVKVGDYIYLVGQMVQDTKTYNWMALTLVRIDTTSDTITYEQKDEAGTGDREFIGIDTDETNLYCGTIAGQVWSIPISTWNNYATWTLKWTDPNAYYSSFIVTWTNNKTYVYLVGANQKWRVVSSNTSDLGTWATEIDYTSQTTGDHTVGSLVVCGDTLVALGYVTSTSSYHLFKFNGSTWDDYDLSISRVSGETTEVYGTWLPDESKLSITVSGATTRTHDLYTVTTTGTSKTLECDNLSGSANGWSPRNYTLTAYDSTYYYSILASAAPGYINRLSRGHSLSGHCQTDFDDIRFTKSDGTTSLDYWLESKTDSVSAWVWIEVDSLPTSGVNTCCYYGDADGVSGSSITTTFPFADDFNDASVDTGKWYRWLSGGTYSETGGIFSIAGASGSYEAWGAKTKYGTNYTYRGLVKTAVDPTADDLNPFGFDDRSDDGNVEGAGVDNANFRTGGASKYYSQKREGTESTSSRTIALASTYKTVEIQRNSATNTRYLINGILYATIATNVPTDSCGLIFWSNYSANINYWDWVLVRKYTLNEPMWAAWGSEQTLTIEITNTPGSKDFGVLEVNTTANTAINYFTITNTGTTNVNVVIQGTDLSGGDDTWDLSDTATPNENIYGLYAGLDDADDSFDIIIRETATYNTLVSNLAEDATQSWGLKIYMPTSVTNYDSQEMAGTITLVASEA